MKKFSEKIDRLLGDGIVSKADGERHSWDTNQKIEGISAELTATVEENEKL